MVYTHQTGRTPARAAAELAEFRKNTIFKEHSVALVFNAQDSSSLLVDEAENGNGGGQHPDKQKGKYTLLANALQMHF